MQPLVQKVENFGIYQGKTILVDQSQTEELINV